MLLSLIIIFLLFSALFSGTEIAFISASKLRVELNRMKGSRQGTILAKFYDKPASFLSSMLVGNNIALVVFTTLMSALLTPFFSQVFDIQNEALLLFINTLIVTFVILIFGEFLPKTLFRLYANEILYFLAIPLRMLEMLLYIPSWIMTHLSSWLLKFIFKAPVESSNNVLTLHDLEYFIKDTLTDDDDEIDANLFEKALQFRNVKVKECMVPRTEVEYVEVTSGIEELISKFMETNHSRIIVCKGDMDNVLGYTYHQQMLASPDSIGNMIMPMPFVPEAMRVRDLLNKFIKERKNIACVVDEYGGTAGIITLEDILEEIFGEIEDEYDQEEYVETQVSEKEYIFSGRLEIDYLNEKYENLELPEGDYHTLSGYLVMTTSTIPEQGAEIILNGYKFVLELVSDTKIETIRVIKLDDFA